MNKVYVVTEREYHDADEEAVWTLSEDPNEAGWWTDSGCPGYALSKEKAEFYAKCINYCIENGIKFDK